MKVQPISLHCLKCKHEWEGEMLVEVALSVAAAVIAALRCPACGADSKSVALGRGDVPTPPPAQSAGMTDLERRAAWLRLRDNGVSSECLADVMCGRQATGAYPHDGDDFGRCERLLALYPEWRARLHEMGGENVVWASLVLRWDEIAAAWRSDAENYRTGIRTQWRCHELLRSIIGPAEKLRGVLGRASAERAKEGS